MVVKCVKPFMSEVHGDGNCGFRAFFALIPLGMPSSQSVSLLRTITFGKKVMEETIMALDSRAEFHQQVVKK